MGILVVVTLALYLTSFTLAAIIHHDYNAVWDTYGNLGGFGWWLLAMGLMIRNLSETGEDELYET